MSLENYFRALLVIYILLFGAEIACSLLTIKWLPAPLRDYVEAQMNDSAMDSQMAMLALLSVAALGLMIISVAGLWFFWRPARPIYTIFVLALACVVAASGTIVQSALTTVLSFITTIINGVILGMIYFSPLREHFDAPPADHGA